jgi:hypothetical protein
MALSSSEHHAKKEDYMAILTKSIKEQLPIIKEMHLLPVNSISIFDGQYRE